VDAERPDEAIDACAERELIEETGAEEFEIHPLCEYGVVMGEKQSYGRLYMAEIKAFGTCPILRLLNLYFSITCLICSPGLRYNQNFWKKLLK
jgi:8-oxo-dGTP pyrophosphatase MutT (NUDIX family)